MNKSETNWREVAEKLWELLDDISTASDVYKPEQNGFYEHVMKKADERNKYFDSDGYKLYPPGEMPKVGDKVELPKVIGEAKTCGNCSEYKPDDNGMPMGCNLCGLDMENWKKGEDENEGK